MPYANLHAMRFGFPSDDDLAVYLFIYKMIEMSSGVAHWELAFFIGIFSVPCFK